MQKRSWVEIECGRHTIPVIIKVAFRLSGSCSFTVSPVECRSNNTKRRNLNVNNSMKIGGQFSARRFDVVFNFT